jgi:hypothetical protein
VTPVYGATSAPVAAGMAAGGGVADPALQGATKSPLYAVAADGAPLFVNITFTP